MELDEQTNLEYVLLRNYGELTLPTRGILLKMNFDAIEKIENDSWFIQYSGPDVKKSKRMVISMMQIEIISKIMMYIEDFAIIAQSLLRGTNHYKLLDQKKNPNTGEKEDVGDIVSEFFSKLNSLTNDEVCKILSYGQPDEFNLDYELVQMLKTSREKEVNEFKRVVQLIGDFGKEHHPSFHRYKHAGLPMAPGLRIIEPLPEYVKKFDFITVVYTSKDPFDEPKIIPYSKEVIEAYKIMIQGIQKMLNEIVTNRKAFIQREKPLPPIPWKTGPEFSPDEIKKYESILPEYDKLHPTVNTDFVMNVKIKNADTWYAKLEDYLAECKKIYQMDAKFAEKTDYRYFPHLKPKD